MEDFPIQMDHKMISRAALGRMASVGDLYDIRTDNFCGLSIFKQSIDHAVSAIKVKDSPSSDIQLMHSDSFSEKFSKLDVNADLSASVLAELFTLKGSGKYLSDQKKTCHTLKSSLLYKIHTKDENLNVFHEGLKEAYSMEAIKSRMATHIVVGISWGANSIVSCSYEKKDNREDMDIAGKLSAQMNKLSYSVSGNVSAAGFTEADHDNNIQFDVRIFGDILPKNGDLPTTFGGALQFMRQLPSLVSDCNEGKGKPVSYRLIPIMVLQQHLTIPKQFQVDLQSLEGACAKRVVQIFDQFSEALQKFNEFYQDVAEYKCCVKDEDMLRIRNFNDTLGIEETGLRNRLSSALTDVRSGKKESPEIETLIREFSASPLSASNINCTLEVWKTLREKITFAKRLIQNGATYVGAGSSVEDKLLMDIESRIYLFFFSEKAKSGRASEWEGNCGLFFKELKKNSGDCKYYAVDCDHHPDLLPANLSCVKVYKGNKCVLEDVGKLQKKEEEDKKQHNLTMIRRR